MKVNNIKHILAVLLLCVTIQVASSQTSLDKIPEAGPTPEVKLQTPEMFTLKNNLNVLVVTNHKLPQVVMALVLDNPPKLLKDNKGVASVISNMLGTGTTRYSKSAFNETLDKMGASMSFSYNSTNARTLSKYFPEVLELMAEAIKNPNFTEEEFLRSKNILLNSLFSEEKNTSAIASKVENSLLYGKNHPYGELTSPEKIEQLSLTTLKELYHQQYLPNNAYLVVMGDVSLSEVKKEVTKQFSDWKKGSIKNENYELNTIEGLEINVVNVPSASQTEVSIIKQLPIQLSDDDYFPLLLANQILGGDGTGRLYQNIREDKGYSYGAYASVTVDRYVSSLDAFASVRTEVAHKAIEEFLHELNRIQNTNVSTDELATAKATITGDFVVNSQSPGTIATLTLNKIVNKLPDNFYKSYLQKVAQVTTEDIKRVAKKYYNLNHARIVVTGNAKMLHEGLKTLQLPITFYDGNANVIPAPITNKPLPNGLTSNKVLQDYFDTIGGVKKMKGVTSISQELTASFQGQQLKAIVKAKSPNQSYNALEVTGMGTVYKQVFNGETGYVEQMGQKSTLPAETIRTLKTKELFDELSFYQNKAYKVILTGIVSVNNKDAYEIEVTSPTNDKTKYYYDVKSKLKVLKKVYEQDANGEIIVSNTGYSNYELVKGIKLPKTLSLPISGTQVSFTAQEVLVNEPLAEDTFQ